MIRNFFEINMVNVKMRFQMNLFTQTPVNINEPVMNFHWNLSWMTLNVGLVNGCYFVVFVFDCFLQNVICYVC